MKKAYTSKNIIQQVYGKVILLAFFSHILFMIIFAMQEIMPLFIYNIGSCILYIGIYILTLQKRFRTAVILTHLEICLFVSFSCLYAGWVCGFALYLLALSSLVYFCPFTRKYIPYLFSGTEMILFLVLKVLSMRIPPVHMFRSQTINSFYIFNALASFTLILYAAVVTKLSAVITEEVLKRSNNRLQDLVDHDALTKVWSRRHLTAVFQSTVAANKPVSIVLTDIDNFKKINDTYGHDCGDYVLSELGQILKDASPDDTGICRWGGEEFVLLFPNENPDAVIPMVENIRKTIAAYPFKYEKQPLQITMTFGISNCTEATDLKELIRIADKRMYLGKKMGKNTVISANMKLPAE